MIDNVTSALFAKSALGVTDLECEFILVQCNDEAYRARFSDDGYEVAGLILVQPIHISDVGNLGQVFDQSEVQNMYLDIGGGGDDSIEATLGLSLQTLLWLPT